MKTGSHIDGLRRHALHRVLGLLFLPGLIHAQKPAVLPQDTLALVGSSAITARDLLLRMELMPFPGKQSKAEAETLKARALYALIAEKVLARAANRQGINEDDRTRVMKRELENLFVRDELYKREIAAHAAPSREEIAVGMNRVVKELQVLSFLVRSENEGRALARLLRMCKPDSVLQKIARSFYTQADTIMVRFGVPDTAFENAAYEIDSSRVSRVLSSNNFGWAILFLLDKRTYKAAVELGLPDRQRRVEQTLRSRREQQLVGTYSFGILRSRRANADSVLFNMLADSVSMLWKEDTSHFKSRGRFIITSDLVDLLMLRLSPSLASTFVTIDDGNLSLEQVLEMFRYLDFTSTACEGELFKWELNDAVKDLVAKELLVREGRRLGLHNTREVQRDVQQWTDFWAARSLYYRIRDSVSVSGESIIHHLVKNQNLFGSSYEVNIREILGATLQDVAKVLDEMERGRSLDALARTYSRRTEWARRGGESGYFDVSDHPEIGFRALMADTVGLVGPVKLTEGYSIFKVLGKRTTTRALTGFDTLKANVRRRLLTERRKEVLDRYVAEQALDQKVVIDHKKLERVSTTLIPMFTRRYIGFGGRIAASPLLMQMWDWIKQFEHPPSILP